MGFEYAKDNKLIKEVPTKNMKLPKKKKTVCLHNYLIRARNKRGRNKIGEASDALLP
ncbi:hypothetical protein GCM10027286_24580 [Virgibacillus ainsalahensis]